MKEIFSKLGKLPTTEEIVNSHLPDGDCSNASPEVFSKIHEELHARDQLWLDENKRILDDLERFGNIAPGHLRR